MVYHPASVMRHARTSDPEEVRLLQTVRVCCTHGTRLLRRHQPAEHCGHLSLFFTRALESKDSVESKVESKAEDTITSLLAH